MDSRVQLPLQQGPGSWGGVSPSPDVSPLRGRDVLARWTPCPGEAQSGHSSHLPIRASARLQREYSKGDPACHPDRDSGFCKGRIGARVLRVAIGELLHGSLGVSPEAGA